MSYIEVKGGGWRWKQFLNVVDEGVGKGGKEEVKGGWRDEGVLRGWKAGGKVYRWEEISRMLLGCFTK